MLTLTQDQVNQLIKNLLDISMDDNVDSHIHGLACESLEILDPTDQD